MVYEDPWLAGGHNGLSNSEDPLKPQPPYERVRNLRSLMNEFKLQETPIIMVEEFGIYQSGRIGLTMMKLERLLFNLEQDHCLQKKVQYQMLGNKNF